MSSPTKSRHVFAGVLLDFDGTIIDSTEAIVENWKRLARELKIDYHEILRTSHGRRSIDVLHDLDPTKANWDYVSAMESQIPYLGTSRPVEIPGARRLLESLERIQVPYAIVTSGTKALLESWISILELPKPQVAVMAEDVKVGKPDPEGYRRAREKLFQSNNMVREVLVIEDAPAGVKAGKAAGCKVLAVVTTHTVEQLKDAGADWVVSDHRSVEVEKDQEQFYFTFRDTL